jgi:peroxiredoxin
MQKAVDKYKNDKEVVFLFVDTWERVPDPAKTAGDFIASKNYTFQVLLDNENTVVSSFGVQGIPTKFVLDGQGKIRFTSVGFSGSEDGLVEELSLMVESARKAGNP